MGLSETAAARLAIVEEHVRYENRHDLAGIMSTFGDAAEYTDAPRSERHADRGVARFAGDRETGAVSSVRYLSICVERPTGQRVHLL